MSNFSYRSVIVITIILSLGVPAGKGFRQAFIIIILADMLGSPSV